MKFTTQKSVLPFKLPMQGKKNCLKQPILLIDPSLEAGIQGRGFEPPFLFLNECPWPTSTSKRKTEQYSYTI